MEKKQKSHIRPIVYVMISVFLIIGYAYLTSSLTINGSTLLKKATWDVHFENVQVKDGSVTGDQVTQEPEIDSEQTTVSFHVNLKKPGDFYEFTVDAVNAGTIDAMINTYTEFDLTEDQLKYLETSVTYEDGEEIAEKQQLLAGDFAVYKIVVSFKKDISEDDLPSTPDQLDLTYSVEYVQKDGTSIERRIEAYSLYNVFKKDYDNNGSAAKYIGEHQDSMDVSKSIKDIYYWSYKSSGGSNPANKYNVLFANHCWNMVRTTDTGGVKLLYNGLTVDNKCLDDRGSSNIGYDFIDNIAMSSNYWYGSSYEYDLINKKFTLSGELIQSNWNSSTSNNLIGKYTCKATSSNASCSSLYLIDSFSSNSSANAFQLLFSSKYSYFGKVDFNEKADSIAYVGYMYGNEYKLSSSSISNSYSTTTIKYVGSRNNASVSYYYSDIYDYSNTDNLYELIDPYKITDSSEYESLVGKYTFLSSNENNSNNSIYYIVSVYNSNLYLIELSNGETLSDYEPIIFGDSIIDNGNGSYTIDNTSNLMLSNWYIDYSNYSGKYTCLSNSVTCNNPIYISFTDSYRFNYIDYTSFIRIAKRRDENFNLIDSILVRRADLTKNPTNYSDYKLTCGNTDSTCTEQNFRYIVKVTSSSIWYAFNKYYGSSVIWDGIKYTLTDAVAIDECTNIDCLKNHRYYCDSSGSKSCTSVNYITYANSSADSYLKLTFSNGVLTFEESLNLMLRNNVNDSTIKKANEYWYEKYLLKYDSYIEDTIFCNSRRISSYGMWSPEEFGSSVYHGINFSYSDFGCPYVTDQFSVSNNQAKLKYKVGLLTGPEFHSYNVTSYGIYTASGSWYWLMSASGYGKSNGSSVNAVSAVGNYSSWDVNDGAALRPSISLKPGVLFESGDGSKDNPYYIRTEYDD